jgi:hypothetical protein
MWSDLILKWNGISYGEVRGGKSTMYPLFNKNQAAWNFLSPELEVTWRTGAIIIRVVLLSPYLCIRGVSLSAIHYNQSRRVYINQIHQFVVKTYIKRH